MAGLSMRQFAAQYAKQRAEAPAEKPKKPKVRGVKRNDLEGEVAIRLQALKIAGYIREHQFHPVRKWRFDFAWPAYKFALEVDGGVFAQSERLGHSSAQGVRQDYERDTAALMLGWTVFRVHCDMVKKPEMYDVIARWVGDGGPKLPQQTELI